VSVCGKMGTHEPTEGVGIHLLLDRGNPGTVV